MALNGQSSDLDVLCRRIAEVIAPLTGRVEYGNLRSKISDYDCGRRGTITNIALVYETPGGSTDQINIEFDHAGCTFALIDEEEGEVTTTDVEVVLERIAPRISGIPGKRHEALCDEIRRQVDDGTNTAGIFGHLNRILQSEFKGGTITLVEFKDAMTFAAHYMQNHTR
jgi:hypothetical protein